MRYLVSMITFVFMFANANVGHSNEEIGALTRDQLKQLLGRSVKTADNVVAAVSNCTFSLFARALSDRAKTLDTPNQFVLLVDTQHIAKACVIGDLGRPPWKMVHDRTLEPVLVEKERNLVLRREFLIVDDYLHIVMLSPMDVEIPSTYMVYRGNAEGDDDLTQAMEQAKHAVFPNFFQSVRPQKTIFEPRWSTDFHRQITREILGPLGFKEDYERNVQLSNTLICVGAPTSASIGPTGRKRTA